MNSFKDIDNNEWTIRIDTEIAQILKDEGLLDIDDVDSHPEKVFGPIVDGNREWLPRVLCICIDEQRKRKQVEKIRFDGDSLDAGAECLQQAIIDFFPKSKRPALAAALDKTTAANELMIAKAVDLLNGDEVKAATHRAADKMIKKAKEQITGL